MDITTVLHNELNYFSHYPKCFTVNDVADYVDLAVDPPCIRDFLLADPRFLCIENNLAYNEAFVSKAVLVHFLVYFSIRLAKAKKSRITISQLLTMLSSIGLLTEHRLPEEIVSLGQSFGLIGRTYKQGEYFFPIAHLISFLIPHYPIKTIFDLINASLETIHIPTNRVVTNNIKSALSQLGQRESYVLMCREGFLKGGRKTLREIADEFGCTRETIRQIEKNARRRSLIIRPLLTALLRDIVDRRGCLIYEISSRTALRMFIAKCLNIPYLELRKINLVIFGLTDKRLQQINCPDKMLDYTGVANWLETEFKLPLLEEDLMVLAACLSKRWEEKFFISRRVYETLRDIGKPAHYSTIAEHYNLLFPERLCTEQGIHSALMREEYGVVWIGAKGVYALKEWGYKRPTKGLYDTVEEIVEKKYKNTGRPVSFEVIVAELGKYRKFINPSSMLMSIHSNPVLRRVTQNSFIPARFSHKYEEQDSMNELDKILKEFQEEEIKHPTN
jgi:transcriptional regulator with XRE-family HTH domain